MECVVLAGGVPAPSEALWAQAGGRPKALLPLAGRPMVCWVLDALLGSRHVDHIILVGLPAGSLGEHDPRLELVPGQGDVVANLYAGLARLRGADPALFCWSDIPLLRAEMVDRFVDAIAEPEVDVVAGLVPRELLQASYPTAEDLWLGLREGEFIAADLGLFRPLRAPQARIHLEALAPLRKSAWRQAWTVGLPVLLRYVTGRLGIADLEAHLWRRYGLRCSIRVVEDPELGMDVDGAADLELCRRVLEGAPTS